MPFVQTLLQLPQSSEFVDVSMQTSPHSVKPVAHPHTPLPHNKPGAHAFEHIPQYSGFELRFTHAPLQSVNPSGQLAAHTLFAQAGVEPEHVVLHAPQWFGSLVRSTHVSPHIVCPGGHAHVPLSHACDAPHLWPHEPQLSRSFAKSRQVPAQKSVPGGQLSLQVPPRHAMPVVHSIVQLPQCSGSDEVSTHVPLHIMPGAPPGVVQPVVVLLSLAAG